MDFHKKWKEQCEASVTIKEHYGIEKALGYLIGEKLFLHLQMAEKDELWENEVIPFCNEIKDLFEQYEIKGYLDNIKRTGPAGHVMSDEEYEEVGEKMFEFDVVQSAESILRLEKVRSLLIKD